VLGGAFNHSIDALSNCTRLKILVIGGAFNQPIDALSNCTVLEKICCSKKYEPCIARLRESVPNLMRCDSIYVSLFMPEN